MNIFRISLFFLAFSFLAKTQTTIYYDADWKETTKDKHVFYRPPVQKVKDLDFLKDYYKDGTLQFQAYTQSGDESKYVGDAFWYDENGNDSSFSQYVNNSSVKELTYYYPNGSIWKKNIYNSKGKISKIIQYLDGKVISEGIVENGNFSGVFPPNFSFDYRNDENNDPPYIATMEIAPPSVPETLEQMNEEKKVKEVKDPKKTKYYYKTIFWANGKKAKETQFNAYNSKQYDKYWSKEGVLLYDSSQEKNQYDNKVDYTFFTQNNLAKGFKTKKYDSKKNNVNYKFEETYYPNGKLLSVKKYVDWKIYEVKNYDQNGNETIQKYKEEKPYDGFFEIEQGKFVQTFKLENGVNVGTEYLKDRDNNQNIYEGIYKDGKPFKGTFYQEINKLLEFDNFKENGTQKVYDNLWGMELNEEYQMKAGKKEGFRKIYEKGELQYESIYKNDTIFSGKVREEDEVLTYENGNLTERSTFDRDFGMLSLVQEYKNNQLESVLYSNFTISEVPKDFYEGTYKNGEPFQGYFLTEPILDDIKFVNFYEKGILKYKYSFDFLEQLEGYRHYIYNIKSEFKDGKIFNGFESALQGRYGVTRVGYKSGIAYFLNLDIFAMHYFNRIQYEIINKVLTVKDMQSKIRLKITEKANELDINLYNEKDELIISNMTDSKESDDNAFAIFYIQDNELKKFVRRQDKGSYGENFDNSSMLIAGIYNQILMINKNNVQDVLDYFIKMYQKGNLEESLDPIDSFPFKEDEIVGYIEFDDKSKPYNGVRITEEKGIYTIEEYVKSKLKSKNTAKTLDELKKKTKAIIGNNQIK